MTSSGGASVAIDPMTVLKDEVDAYLGLSRAPGVCVSLYDSDYFDGPGLVYPTGVSGLPGPAHPDPAAVTGDTVFQVGSVTKVFTATLLACAVEAGKARLEDTLGAWLNRDHSFGPSPIGTARLRALTLRQLATQTSGMPDQPAGLTDYSRWLFSDEVPGDPLIAYWNAYDGPAPAGCYRYSNIGFVTLGEAVTQMFPRGRGHNYNAALRRHVTHPLGMPNTGAIVPAGAAAATGCIAHWDRGRFTGQTPVTESAFDLKSTGADLLRFLRAQLGVGTPPDDPTLAHAIGLTQAIQGTFPKCDAQPGPHPDVTMGLAWQITQDARTRAVIYAKNGATSRGGSSAMVLFVRSASLSFGVAVLVNQFTDGKSAPRGVAPGALAHQILWGLHPEFKPADPQAELGRLPADES